METKLINEKMSDAKKIEIMEKYMHDQQKIIWELTNQKKIIFCYDKFQCQKGSLNKKCCHGSGIRPGNYAIHNGSENEIAEKYAIWAKQLFMNNNPFKKEYFQLPLTIPGREGPMFECFAPDLNGNAILYNICNLLPLIKYESDLKHESDLKEYIEFVKSQMIIIVEETSEDI